MKARWLIVGGLLALPTFLVARRIEWWFHEESGLVMAGDLGQRRISNVEPEVARAFVSEVCGEPVEFDRTDKSAYWTMMAEKKISRHFTLYGLFRNTIWVAVGAHGRFCLARYEVAMRRHGCVWPFPYCNYASWMSLDEVRLVDRIQTKPKVPPGVRSLFPGECASGELPAGASAKFQVEVPDFGQRVEIFAVGDNREEVKLEVETTKNGKKMKPGSDDLMDMGTNLPGITYLNGREMESKIDGSGGGTYGILLRAPDTDSKRYI
jgi:hypothetical protein